MSPRNPLPRQTPKQYAQAVRNALPVKQAVKQDVITWQASHLEGEFWRILTHKGYPLATVGDAVTQPNISAQQAAELMADAPQLLNELALAHEIIRAALSLMDAQTKGQWADKNALLGIDGEGTTRANERLALLAKHSHLLGGVQ